MRIPSDVDDLRRKVEDCIVSAYTKGYKHGQIKAIALVYTKHTPCDLCAYNPPSSCDGKPCTVCPATRRGDIE